jgi:hypothetical protein
MLSCIFRDKKRVGFDIIKKPNDISHSCSMGLLSAIEDKRLEVSVMAAAKAQAVAHFEADKPRPDRPDRQNDKPDKPDKHKVKPKDRTGGRPLPATDKAHKKTEADKEE